MHPKIHSRIQALPLLVANQIAAGEVIERPASIVKELLENSIDAGAKRIYITVKKSGTELINIQDDGMGIFKDDLRLALSPHATSKIYSVNDLEHISSLGFRGEALASIAAISRLNLISATENETASQIGVTESGEFSNLMPAGHPKGTTVTVQDIFYNTPVRRKFLRSLKTEWQHIDDIIKRVALSHFDLAIQVTHNEKPIYNLSQANDDKKREKRVEKLCGKRFLEDSLYFSSEAEGLVLSGWITKPSASRPHSDLQYCFLNGRMIKDKLINHAIRQAAQDLISEGRHLGYILYLSCDPAIVDVNVHPTKHEVRFHDNRLIHDFVMRTIRKELLSDAEDHVLVKSSYVYQAPTRNYGHSSKLGTEETFSNYGKQRILEKAKDLTGFGKIITQLKKRYLLTEINHGLFLIDLEKAFFLAFSDQLEKASVQKPLISQPLLIPVSLTLGEKNIEALEKIQEWEAWGINWQQQKSDTITVRHLPAMLKGVNLEGLFLGLLKAKNKVHLISQLASKMAYEMADHAELAGLLSDLSHMNPEAIEGRSIYRFIDLKISDDEYQTI